MFDQTTGNGDGLDRLIDRSCSDGMNLDHTVIFKGTGNGTYAALGLERATIQSTTIEPPVWTVPMRIGTILEVYRSGNGGTNLFT
ncbi:hypothetical protein KKG90_04615 [Candidatus Bipolaricaulota bacterium]|nr:hypothetical protein [Candidatus Bipolaricaulota bacterium]